MNEHEQIFNAAQDVITDNLSHVDDVTLWFVGAAKNGKEKIPQQLSLHARLVFTDGRTEMIRYKIPEEMLEELDTIKALFAYGVEYLINHLILPQYFAKLN